MLISPTCGCGEPDERVLGDLRIALHDGRLISHRPGGIGIQNIDGYGEGMLSKLTNEW